MWVESPGIMPRTRIIRVNRSRSRIFWTVRSTSASVVHWCGMQKVAFIFTHSSKRTAASFSLGPTPGIALKAGVRIRIIFRPVRCSAVSMASPKSGVAMPMVASTPARRNTVRISAMRSRVW